MAKFKPQESIVIEFSDELGTERKGTDFAQMIEDLRETMGRYGFDVSSWGSRQLMMRFFIRCEKD